MSLAGAVAALSALAIAVPVSTAGADTVGGQPATVIGPTFITSAPTTFVNTNTQVSDGPISAGSLIAP